MRTIGLIGGMSWESSAEYYRVIMPVFGTARIHAEATVDWALA